MAIDDVVDSMEEEESFDDLESDDKSDEEEVFNSFSKFTSEHSSAKQRRDAKAIDASSKMIEEKCESKCSRVIARSNRETKSILNGVACACDVDDDRDDAVADDDDEDDDNGDDERDTADADADADEWEFDIEDEASTCEHTAKVRLPSAIARSTNGNKKEEEEDDDDEREKLEKDDDEEDGLRYC